MAKTPVYSTPQEIDTTPFSGLAASSAFALQDLVAIRSTLDGVNAAAGQVSVSLTRAFSGASTSARLFQTTLSSVASSLGNLLVGVGASALTSGLSSIVGGLFSGGGGGGVAPFAEGGIVASPTFFGSGGGLGLMGERGAEAILPLARGPNGELGLASAGDRRRPVVLTVNIQTQDVESFRRSEAQVGAALARAVARGQRAL